MQRHSEKPVTDDAATYLPLGMRPGPYPPGFQVNDPRWSGDRLVRVKLLEGEPDQGLPMADSAPVPNKRLTAHRSRSDRVVYADTLPIVSTLAIATAVSDDPGWLAIHGRRVSGAYAPSCQNAGDSHPDLWRGPKRQRVTLPVGGVLVSRVGGTGSTAKGWNIWRVLPTGPTCVLENAVSDTMDGLEKIAIAAAIDRDLRHAFEQSVRTLRRGATSDQHRRAAEHRGRHRALAR